MGRNRRIKRLGPAREAGYTWIYLVGFGENMLKAGASRVPMDRTLVHRNLGEIKWVHFAGKVKNSHWVVMESAVLRELDQHGKRFSRFTEIFNGIDKPTAISATRAAMQRMREMHCNDTNDHYRCFKLPKSRAAA